MSRVKKLAEAARARGVEAFLAWHPLTMRYLTGLNENPGERFAVFAIHVETGQARYVCPALSENQARRHGIEDIASWRDGEDPYALFKEIAASWGLKSAILAVDDELPAAILLNLQEILPAALFKSGGGILAEVTRRKDADELAAMQRAATIADEAFREVLACLRPGLTEREVFNHLMEAMASRGGLPTFGIVGAGPNGAEPHHLVDDTVLKAGDVLIMDFGCEVDGYQSDITRTVAIGEPSDVAKRTYAAVYRAHMASRAAVRPGALNGEVDAAGRQEIIDQGWGNLFFHRTGHGIGMRVHEAPNIVPGGTEPLQVGDCFSIEPGVYRAGEFGVRIENIVTVTEDGVRSFNEDPAPELLVV